jgi:hypothetical protein
LRDSVEEEIFEAVQLADTFGAVVERDSFEQEILATV